MTSEVVFDAPHNEFMKIFC